MLNRNHFYERVEKVGDVYKVAYGDVPKSLINAFVTKCKKEMDKDLRETWSDMDIAEMLFKYVMETYMNLESIPLTSVLATKEGEEGKTPGIPIQPVQPNETPMAQPMAQPQMDTIDDVQNSMTIQPQAQPQAQAQPQS